MPVRNAKAREMRDLLESTRLQTRVLLSGLDPDRVIHTDARAWTVRDILGHLAVWNGEAARGLEAFSEGGEYVCIASEAEYDAYNGPAADERRTWTTDEVWAEYDAEHDELKRVVEALPAEKWGTQMVYPWNVRGTPERLVAIMMKHERVDHCDLVRAALG